MRVGLGSTNEAKVEAAERAVEEFLDVSSVDSVDVESPDQPMSVEEAREGAIYRAEQVSIQGYDLVIGNEGFVAEIGGDYFLSTVTVLYEDEEVVGEGFSGMIKLPQDIQERLPNEELGELIKSEIGNDISEEGGAISLLTNGRKNRPEFTYTSLLHAFND